MGNKAILEKIKELLTGKEVSLSAELSFLTVEAGDVTIQVEGEAFEVGQAVSIATEEGFIPAGTSLDGDHTIEGVTITITDGIITEVKEETVAEEVEEEIVEENKIEVLSEVKLQSYDDYPEQIKETAQAVLDYVAENGWGDCGTEVGKVRANQLAKGEPISEETIQRMYSYLSRHKVDLETSVDYETGCGKLMYDAWGGEAALEWSKSKLEEIGNIETLKFQELEDKISKLEETITSITEKLTKSEEKLEAFSNKVEKVWDAAPAEPKLENFKTESNIKKTFNNPLEGIRSIRSKK